MEIVEIRFEFPFLEKFLLTVRFFLCLLRRFAKPLLQFQRVHGCKSAMTSPLRHHEKEKRREEKRERYAEEEGRE